MRRAIATIAVLLGLSLPIVRATDDESTASLIAHAPAAAAHPQANAVCLLNDVRLEVDGQFSTTRTVRQVVKLLTSQAREDYGQLRIAYEAGEETLEIIKAVTFDGASEMAAPKEGITEITPPGDAAAKMYTNQKIKVISMPGLKEGVVIELIYRVKRAKPRIEGKFSDSLNLQETVPMQRVRYALVVPKGMRFQHVVERTECMPEVTHAVDRSIYRWQLANVPAIVPEPYTPPLSEIVPWLYITNWESWQEVGDWYASLSASSAQADESVRGFVSAIAKSKPDKQSQMAALYHAVAGQIRYVSLSFGMGGYRPHAAAETLKNRYGDCKDKATLIVAALSELGIKAHMVLINSSTEELSTRAPSPGAFNHAIVAVPMGDDYLWLDPTSETCSFGNLPAEDQNKLALVVERGASRLVRTPLMPAEKNMFSVVMSSELAEEGNLQGTITWKNLGAYDSLFRAMLKGATPEQQRQWLAGFIAKMAGVMKTADITISDVEDLSTPLVISFKFQAEGLTTEVADMLMVKLPELLFLDDTLAGLTAGKDRKHPALFGFAMSFQTELSLRLPAGYDVQALPKEMMKKNEVGHYAASYKMENGTLKMTRKLSIDSARVPASHYSQLKELATAKAAGLRQQVVLKKG